MRKKILSVLLALCMVLTLLPIAAYAAKLTDAQVADLKAKGYTDAQIEEIQKQIADYESDEIVLVFEDTVIDQAESRLVLVVGKCNVEVSAALETGIVVAPGAADAKVALKAGADVNAVVVLDKAEVVVEKDAKAANVTLAAAEAAATVEGSVDTVAVNEAAEKATVTVAEGAAVAAVEVAAPEAKADIAGSVSTVVVAETAKGAETAVAQTAQVSTVTVAAPEAKTDIAGTVSSVTVAETAEGAGTTVSGTVSNVTVDAPNTKTEVAGTGSVGSVNVGENATGTEINAADGASVGEVVDPAGNNSGNTAADPEPSASPSASPAPSVPDEPDEPGPVNPPVEKAPAKIEGQKIIVTTKSEGTVAVAIPVDSGDIKCYALTTVDGKTTNVTVKAPATASGEDYYVNIDVTNGMTVILATADEAKDATDALAALNNATAAAEKAIADAKAAQAGLEATAQEKKAELEAYQAIKTKNDAATALATALSEYDPDGEGAAEKLELIKGYEVTLGLIKEGENAKFDADDVDADNPAEGSVAAAIKAAQEAYTAEENYSSTLTEKQTAATNAQKAATDNKAVADSKAEDAEAVTDAQTALNNAASALETNNGYTVEFQKPADPEPEQPDQGGTTTDPTTPGGPAAGGGETEGDNAATVDPDVTPNTPVESDS